MTASNRRIVAGTVFGAAWGCALVWIGTAWVNLPIAFYIWSLAVSFLFPGLILAALIARLALRRFLAGDERSVGAGIDRQVAADTVEQLVLALALWPVTGHVLAVEGPGVVLALGAGFAVSRIAFWIGSHKSPLLRAYGFAATFSPTLIALGWSFLWWFVN